MTSSKNMVSNQNSVGNKLSLSRLKSLEILKMTSREVLEYVNLCVDENPVILGGESADYINEEFDKKDVDGIFSLIDKISKDKEVSKPDRKTLLKLKELLEYQRSSSNRIVNTKDVLTAGDGNFEGVYMDGDPVDWVKIQIQMSHEDEEIKAGALLLADNLDNDGYLHIDGELLKKFGNLDYFKKSQELLQSQEPIGTGSGDLKEYLILQYKEIREKIFSPDNIEMYDKVFAKILEGFLLNPYAKSFPEYKKLKVEVGSQLTEEVMRLLRSMNLKPFSHLYTSGEATGYIIPDFVVEVNGPDGEIRGSLTSVTAPELRINGEQLNLLVSGASEEIAEFVLERIKKSLLSFKMLNERRETMLRFIDCLVEAQREYFLGGIKYLKRLKQVEIASIMGINQSTLSRMIRDKYVSTPYGTVSLSFFFSEGKKEKLTVRISEIIHENDAAGHTPITDEKISEILEEEGFEISRRTVAKYRALGRIENSYYRRA